jgi:hypothetical protein
MVPSTVIVAPVKIVAWEVKELKWFLLCAVPADPADVVEPWASLNSPRLAVVLHPVGRRWIYLPVGVVNLITNWDPAAIDPDFPDKVKALPRWI